MLLPWLAHREDAAQTGFNVGTRGWRDMVANADAGNMGLVAEARIRLKVAYKFYQSGYRHRAAQEHPMRLIVARQRALDALYSVAFSDERLDSILLIVATGFDASSIWQKLFAQPHHIFRLGHVRFSPV